MSCEAPELTAVCARVPGSGLQDSGNFAALLIGLKVKRPVDEGAGDARVGYGRSEGVIDLILNYWQGKLQSSLNIGVDKV